MIKPASLSDSNRELKNVVRDFYGSAISPLLVEAYTSTTEDWIHESAKPNIMFFDEY